MRANESGYHVLSQDRGVVTLERSEPSREEFLFSLFFNATHRVDIPGISTLPFMAELTTDADISRVLREARTVAVLGAHTEASRPARYVPDYLHGQGYRVLAVNPRLVGVELWGSPTRATLTDLGEGVDIVDVFRRADLLRAHIDEILRMTPPPRVVWLQQGIRDEAFARAIDAAGIDVVQDRCTLADHRRLRIGPVVR